MGDKHHNRCLLSPPFGSLLNNHINKLYAGMSKALSSLLIQMRVGKIDLNAYLHKIKRAERPWCECREGNQTVAHILEECPLYRRQRHSIFNWYVLRNVKLILSNPQTAMKAVNFMLSTGLLDQFRHYRNKMKELTIWHRGGDGVDIMDKTDSRKAMRYTHYWNDTGMRRARSQLGVYGVIWADDCRISFVFHCLVGSLALLGCYYGTWICAWGSNCRYVSST